MVLSASLCLAGEMARRVQTDDGVFILNRCEKGRKLMATDAGEKIVIIGGVAAGPKAACRVKRLMQDAVVTIIDEDSLISYGGCGIPYYVSGDVSDEAELRSTSFHMVRNESFFKDAKGVETLTRTRALAIDRKNKVVLVE